MKPNYWIKVIGIRTVEAGVEITFENMVVMVAMSTGSDIFSEFNPVIMINSHDQSVFTAQPKVCITNPTCQFRMV